MPSTPTRADAATLSSLAATLRAEAAEAHAAYRQYDGYWDGWRVAEITKRVRTKLGVAFEAGDLVLVSPDTRDEKIPTRGGEPYEQWPERTFATAYSRRNKCNTGVFAEDVREIEITDAG